MLCHVRDLRLPLYLLLTKLDVLVGQFMIKDTWTPYYNIPPYLNRNVAYARRISHISL